MHSLGYGQAGMLAKKRELASIRAQVRALDLSSAQSFSGGSNLPVLPAPGIANLLAVPPESGFDAGNEILQPNSWEQQSYFTAQVPVQQNTVSIPGSTDSFVNPVSPTSDTSRPLSENLTDILQNLTGELSNSSGDLAPRGPVGPSSLEDEAARRESAEASSLPLVQRPGFPLLVILGLGAAWWFLGRKRSRR